jgi:hypothetical protein
MNPFPKSLQRVLRLLSAAAPWVLVLAAPAALFHLISTHQVNIPFLDDWMFVHQFVKDPNGFLWTLAKDDVHLTIHDFFRVQMEHRLAFVRAVILTLHKLWPTDYTKWMWTSWVILLLTYNNIAILLRRTTGLTFRAWWPLLALAGLAVFSPLQYRVVLWAMMFQVACPNFFLSSALVVFTSRWPAWLKLTAGILCASLGTQTLASGLLIWVLPLPLVFLGGAVKGRRAQGLFTLAWCLVFGLTLKLYFSDLVNEEDSAFTYGLEVGAKALESDTRALYEDPARSIPYVLRFLGNHLARGSGLTVMDAALWTGAASLTLFLAAAGYFLANFRREELRHRLLPWLLFGSYSIACAMLVCIGRLHASAAGDNALAPRYIVHAVPLTVSLIALGWLIARDLSDRRQFSRVATLLPCAGVAVLCLLLLPWPYGCRLMETWESARLRGATTTMFLKTGLQFEDYVPCNRKHARLADDLGLLDPPMIKNTRLDNFRIGPDTISANTAQWSALTIGRNPKDGALMGKVQGYASLPGRKRVADGIFFTYRDPADGHWQIFHLDQVAAMPMFLMDTLARDVQFVHLRGDLKQEAVSGFDSQFPLAQLPKGVFDVAAWVYDYRRQQLTPIDGCFRIDTENQTVEPLKDDPRPSKAARRGKTPPDLEAKP